MIEFGKGKGIGDLTYLKYNFRFCVFKLGTPVKPNFLNPTKIKNLNKLVCRYRYTFPSFHSFVNGSQGLKSADAYSDSHHQQNAQLPGM
jgi:hypothetical protein